MEKHDVFISYAHIDNQNEWVSEFDRVFSTFLSTWLGRKAKIWRDRSMGSGDYIWETIEENILTSKIMVPIVSPSWVSSEWCPRELSTFIENRRIKAGSDSAVLNIRKMPVEKEQIPDEIRDVLENVLYKEFFKKEESGKIRVLSTDRGEQLRQVFLDNLEDLAQDVFQKLRSIEKATATDEEAAAKPREIQPFDGKTIYLAEPTPDLMEEYLEIKRDFLNRGATILPYSILEPKPDSISDYQAEVEDQMSRSDLIVHFVGSEDSPFSQSDDRSIARLLADTASRVQEGSKINRLIMIPRNVRPDSEGHRDFVQGLSKLTSRNVDILQTPLDLKTEMEQILLKKQAPTAGKEKKETDDSSLNLSNPSVYLIYDREDEGLAKNVSSQLFKKGCEVWTVTPDKDSGKEGSIEEHKWYLSNCDAAIVCWGKAKMFRVRAMMSEFVSIMDNGREKDFVGKGVLIDGKSSEKDGFMTHERMIRNSGELASFVEGLTRGGGSE